MALLLSLTEADMHDGVADAHNSGQGENGPVVKPVMSHLNWHSYSL